MKVFLGDKTSIKNFPKTLENITKFTENEEEIQVMSDIIEEMYGDNLKRAKAEARDEGLKQGRSEGKAKALQNLNEMIKNNCSIDEIRNMISKEIGNSPA